MNSDFALGYLVTALVILLVYVVLIRQVFGGARFQNRPYVSIIIALVLTGLSASAQRIDSVVFKKARKVIIKNQHTAAENFKIAGTALIEKGYMIGKKDEQFNQLVSEPIKTTFAVQVMYLSIKDNEIDITSKSRSTSSVSLLPLPFNDPSYENVVYSKNNDWVIERFKNMTDFAKFIGGDKILISE